MTTSASAPPPGELSQALADAFASAETLREAVPRVLEALGRELDFVAGQYWERDREQGVLRFGAIWRAPQTAIPEMEGASRGLTFAPGEGLPGRVWSEARAIVVSDVSLDDNFPRATVAAGDSLSSAAGFPLGEHAVVGVLELFRRAPGLTEAEIQRPAHLLAAQSNEFLRRVGAQQALRAAEARRAAMLDAALDAVVSMDAQGRVTDWNRAAEQMFGFAREEALGQEMAQLIIPERYRRSHRFGLAHYLKSGEAQVLGKRLELFALRKDGTELPVELTIARIALAGAPEFTGYLRDITDRAQAQARVQEQHAFRERFIGIVGHDLRTPLQGIVGNTALLLRTPLNDKQRRSANHINTSAERMNRMISDLLDLTRGRLGGGIPLEPKPTDLSGVCDQVVEETRAAHPGLAIELHVSGTTAGNWDADRLAQAISNLLGNAALHGDPARRIRVEAKGDEEKVAIAVHNFGPPIPAADCATIFDPFRRGSTRHRTGLGLGLYIAREIAKAHGGAIELSSSEEAGTTFTITLPARSRH